MIDLTRARYLGLAHPHDSLARWAALTSGRPAVLGDGPAIGVLSRWLARLLGFPRATLAPSTLHVVTDLYGALPESVRCIHVDACTYAVSRWGLERARLRGVAIRRFRTPREAAEQIAATGERAIVCDAVCVACRRIKPLRALQRIAARSGSWLIVDDSQGVGLLGAGPAREMPFGRGGGGTLCWGRVPRDRVIAIGSLAKAFGAPIAFLAGSEPVVDWFERTSGTRVHASPCNAASLAALDSALRANTEHGDELRAALCDRVETFRAAVAHRGGVLSGGAFPVQSTVPVSVAVSRVLDERLQRRGVRALRLRPEAGRGRLSFAINADHDRDALAEAGAIIGEELAAPRVRVAA